MSVDISSLNMEEIYNMLRESQPAPSSALLTHPEEAKLKQWTKSDSLCKIEAQAWQSNEKLETLLKEKMAALKDCHCLIDEAEQNLNKCKDEFDKWRHRVTMAEFALKGAKKRKNQCEQEQKTLEGERKHAKDVGHAISEYWWG